MELNKKKTPREKTRNKDKVNTLDITLPKGKDSEKYHFEYKFATECNIENYEIIISETLKGLSWEKTPDKKGFIIQGNPYTPNKKGGEFTLTLRYKTKGVSKSEEWLQKDLTFILEPNPQALQKDNSIGEGKSNSSSVNADSSSKVEIPNDLLSKKEEDSSLDDAPAHTLPHEDKKTIKDYILQVLARVGIKPSKEEFKDFENRLIVSLWDTVKEQRMNEILITQNRVNDLEITISNGTRNKEYTCECEFAVEGVEDYTLEIDDAIKDLSWEKTPEGFSIKGTPYTEDKKGGVFTLILRYKPKGLLENEKKQWFERELPFILNPDPKDLWENHPVPEGTKYKKDDTDTAYITVKSSNNTPRKNIVAASLRGRSHAHTAQSRDDHFLVKYSEETEWYILAVADGAGSAKYAREGSKLACEVAVSYCEKILHEKQKEFERSIKARFENNEPPEEDKKAGHQLYTIVCQAALEAQKEIENVARKDEAQRKKDEAQNPESKPITIKDYHTTLLLTLCKHFEFGWVIGSFWVGDGAICVYNAEEKTAEILGNPDGGEHAGETRFVTMPETMQDKNLYQRMRLKIYPKDFTALILMTDGVSDPKFETDANLQDFKKWDALWKEFKENNIEFKPNNEQIKEQLLKWLEFWDKGNHDDRTIAILY